MSTVYLLGFIGKMEYETLSQRSCIIIRETHVCKTHISEPHISETHISETHIIGTHLKSRVVVPAEVLVADADEAPEGLHGGHVHQQERGDGRLRLEVAHFRVQHRICL